MRFNRPEVRVVTRFKPITEEEQAHHKNKKVSSLCVAFDQQNIEVLDRMHQAGAPPSVEFAKNRSRLGSINEMSKNFTMDEVFSHQTTQAELYERVGRPIVKNVMKGYNGTVLAYGQTGSGKTHSMTGPHGGATDVFSPDSPNYKMRGMIPRMVEELFRRLKSIHRSERTWKVSVSIFEIYKEDIFDLLAPVSTSFNNPAKKYRIREDLVNQNGIYVEDLARPEVQTAEEVVGLISFAANKRKTAVTNINETSSRSHSLVIIYLEQKDYTGDPHGQSFVSRLNLVDLAGSEKVYKTLADGERLQEAKTINLSLTLLGNVIYKLTDGKSGYVPYRDSKLTRILQESLGGNSITTLVCHCSMAMYNREETLSTLRFAQRAKRVRNKPQINKELNAKELKLQLAAAEQKIDTLEKKLRVKSDIMSKQKDSRDEKFAELEALIESLMREIEQLKEELQLKEEELQHERDRAELYKREAGELAAELERERKRNAKEKKVLAGALKTSQAENDALKQQLDELAQELANSNQNWMAQQQMAAAKSAEEKEREERKKSPSPPPKRAVSAPYDRADAGLTVEGQVRRASFMLGRPITGDDGVTQQQNYIDSDDNPVGRAYEAQASHGGRLGKPDRSSAVGKLHSNADKMCPHCGHSLPTPPSKDEETNTNFAITAVMEAMEKNGELALGNGAEAGEAENLRQLGNDEVSRALKAAGQFMGAIMKDNNGDVYTAHESARGDEDEEDGEDVIGEDGQRIRGKRNKKSGDKNGAGPEPSREVLQAVAMLEEVLHVIADAVEKDQFHVPPPSPGHPLSAEEEAAQNAAQEELKEALKMSERVLAAWRASEGDLKTGDMVEQDKKNALPLRLLSKPEREKFKAHEKELAASELEGIQRRLHRQAVAEELATSDKGNLLGRQELRGAIAEEQQQTKELLKNLPEKLQATAEEATQTNGKKSRRVANPHQEKLLQQCFDRLAKGLEEHMAKNGEHLADSLHRELQKDNNANANAHADAMGRGLENMTDQMAFHCDEVLDRVLDKNESVDAATFEKISADLKKKSDDAIAAMYQRGAREAAKDRKASLDKLRDEAKKENEQLRKDLENIVDAEVEKMAMELQAASEGGEMELSKEEIRAVCNGVADQAKEEVNRLTAQHISAVEQSLDSLDAANEAYRKEEMRDCEDKMKKAAASEIGQMVAKMQVLALHEQLAPQGASAPLSSQQLEQLTEQLKLVKNSDNPLTNEFNTPYKEKDRDDWVESEQPRMIEPIKNLSDKIVQSTDDCVAEATHKYDDVAHDSIKVIGKSYKNHMDKEAFALSREVLEAQEQQLQELSPEQGAEVSKALEELSDVLRDINKKSEEKIEAEMSHMTDKELQSAKSAHHALGEREAEHFAAALSTASAAYWGDLLSDDAGTLETFMNKLNNLSADEIEDVAKAHRDLSEEQQKALAQQLQRLYGKEQQKAHQRLADAVEEKVSELAATLHAQEEKKAMAREATGEDVSSEETAAAHATIDEMCAKIKRDALDSISAVEKNEREFAAAELAQMATRQSRIAVEEEEAMRAKLQEVAKKDLGHMQDRLGNLLVKSMSAAEQRPKGTQYSFTPEKLKTLGDNIDVLIAHESEDPYSNSLRSLLSKELKEAARGEADRFYLEAMEVAAAQHDKTLKSTDAQCAKDVRVIAQRQVAMGENDLEEVPEKLMMMMQGEVGEELSPVQVKVVQGSMSNLASSLQAFFEQERKEKEEMDKKLEGLTSSENRIAADNHNALSRAVLKSLSGEVSRRLENDFQELIDKQERISPQKVDLVAAKIQELCNHNIAELCEQHGRLSEAESREMKERIHQLCTEDDGLEREKVGVLVNKEMESICKELSTMTGEDALSPEQIDVVRVKMHEMADDEISRHYDKKSSMTAEEANAMTARLGELNARSNVQLMERLQAFTSDSVQKMASQVAHTLLTASQEGYAEKGYGGGALVSSEERVKPSVARAVVNELIAEEVANCMKEAQLNAQEYVILADQVLELNPKNKRDLADHLRKSISGSEQQKGVLEAPTSTEMVVYTQPITRQQYQQLSTQIEKLADLDASRSSVQHVPVRNIERLSSRIQDLSRPEFTLLCKRLDMQVMEQTPREQMHQSTMDAIRALVNYIGSVNSRDNDNLTTAMIQGNIDPVTLNRVLRILSEAAGYQATPNGEEVEELVPLHAYESTRMGLTAREVHSGAEPMTLQQWTRRVQNLTDTLEDAAIEEVEPNAKKPVFLAIEDRQPVLLLRDYSEGRSEATGCPLAFMSPATTHRAEVVELADSTEDHVEEALVLSDMNALQAAEAVIRRHLAEPEKSNPEEMTAAATTVEKVIQHAVMRHPMKDQLVALEASEETSARGMGEAPRVWTAEEKHQLLVAKLEQLQAQQGEEVMPTLFDLMVQEYLQQSDEVQDALEIIQATEKSDTSHSRLEGSERRLAIEDTPARRKEQLQSMQVIADAVAVVLDKQRAQILSAYEEENETAPPRMERGLTAIEANRILWATQNLGASMQAEEESPILNEDRADHFPRQIQYASAAMRCLVNEAMAANEEQPIEGSISEKGKPLYMWEKKNPVWRLLQREDVREAVRAFDSHTKKVSDGDVPIIIKSKSKVEKAAVPIVTALKLPSHLSDRSKEMREGLSVLNYGLNNVEGKPRIMIGHGREHPLVCEPLPTSRDPSKKVLTRYGYAKATQDVGTMTDFAGKVPASLIHGNKVDDTQMRESINEMLWCMGVSKDEIAMMDDNPDAMAKALQRLRREVMVFKKAEEPCMRREIETRHREMACIYDAMEEMIEVVRRSSIDAAERNDVFAQRLTYTARASLVDKLRDQVNTPDLGDSSSSSQDTSLNASKKSRSKKNTCAVAIPTKAMLEDGSFDERMNRKPEPVELQTLPTLEALCHTQGNSSSGDNVLTATPHVKKAEKAPMEVVEALKETTQWMDEFQERYYELMKRYLESFGRAERLDELLDKSRNERDDGKQELDALKLVLDSIRKENNSMKAVLLEMNVDMEEYMTSLEHQKRVNNRLAEQKETLRQQAALLATSAEQQEFLDMGNIELAIRSEEMEEIENALENVQNFYDPDLIAKKRQHIGKDIRSIGTFCQKILDMCQSRHRFNTGNLESQRLNLLQGTAELYNRYEWAKEELNEQFERQRQGVAR